MRPLVAIVGRPNVGKSTLFNRLVGQRRAIVDDAAGVTRDRNYADVEWDGKALTLIDTGGFWPGEVGELLGQVRRQAELAVEECQAVLWVTDLAFGINPADQELASTLRRYDKPVILAVNKVDLARSNPAAIAEFYRLGMGEPLAISAEHAIGIGELTSRIVQALPASEPTEAEADHQAGIRLAVIGRPNVGKSTLINALARSERLVTTSEAGTTRDAIDVILAHGDQTFVLTDTAGIRRRRGVGEGIERYAVLASLKAIDRSDVVALVLDATEPAVDQDAKLADLALSKGRGLLIVVNKWDAISSKARQDAFREQLKHRYPFTAFAPVLFVSALRGDKVDKVLSTAHRVHRQLSFRAPTPKLNRLLAEITTTHPMPIVQGKRLKLYYAAQVGVRPPGFAFTCNRPSSVPDVYKRYLVNQLRKTFELNVPIRLFFRPRPKGKSFKPSRS